MCFYVSQLHSNRKAQGRGLRAIQKVRWSVLSDNLLEAVADQLFVASIV